MKKHTCKLLSTLLVILLLLPACTTTPQAGKSAIVSHELVKTTKSWDGDTLPAYPKGQPEIRIRRITIPAGATLETHLHPVINAGVLLSGELTVVKVDGGTLHLKAGDPIVELVNKRHYGKNEGKHPAEILVVYAGVVGKQPTVLKR
jgi:quercetin dioxygenase-like cupin family protein